MAWPLAFVSLSDVAPPIPDNGGASGRKMSTVPDTQDTPVQYAPKAGNTVETLTPNTVKETPKNPLVQEYKEPRNAHGTVPAPMGRTISKEQAESKTSAKDVFVSGQFEGETESIKEANRLNVEWASRPITRFEFQQLADAVQELAERITKHNTHAPFKI